MSAMRPISVEVSPVAPLSERSAPCDAHPASRYFVQSIEYRTRIAPWERHLYDPVIAWVKAWAARARAVQSGSVHAYLAYLVGALVILVGLLAVGGR